MSRAQSSLDTWTTEPSGAETRTQPQIDWESLTPCTRRLPMDEKVHGLGFEWRALESAVRRIGKHEQLLGVRVIREERRERTTGVVDDAVSQDVARATADGHDYSDCGGDHE